MISPCSFCLLAVLVLPCVASPWHAVPPPVSGGLWVKTSFITVITMSVHLSCLKLTLGTVSNSVSEGHGSGSQLEVILWLLLPRDSWQWLMNLLLSPVGKEELVASSGKSPGMLLNTSHHTGQLPTARVLLPRMSVLAGLRNPGLPWGFSEVKCLLQWFSEHSMRQNHLDGSLKHTAGPTERILGIRLEDLHL